MTEPKEKKPWFDPTVNMGHLLTFVGFIVTIMFSWSMMDKRVVVLEEERKHQADVDRRQDNQIDDFKKSVKEDVHDISNKLDRLIERSNK
ncbi:hypothetical protein ACMYR3_06250 [Ampullimonas aquatilis]|uniref:hypothetical protein n=1 Tax=Ampullimonas aquatilis TaxID=1341549 RepID=UPI003C75CA6A